MCLKIRKKQICASQIIFATMHYDLIIIYVNSLSMQDRPLFQNLYSFLSNGSMRF